jgi:hypothetical protein
MKKLALVKSAIDFAFANYQLKPIALAQASLAAFVAAGGQDQDLTIWNQQVTSNAAEAKQYAAQKLPSEAPVAQVAPAAPAADAVTAK